MTPEEALRWGDDLADATGDRAPCFARARFSDVGGCIVSDRFGCGELISRLRAWRDKTPDAWILHAADQLERLEHELAKITGEHECYRNALLDIRGAHVPDQPASSGADEVTWVMQHVGALRRIAANALERKS